ncbi:hypothetical protein PIB30_103931 [Stylosanthes scabra]|uniref:Cucumopine synthase C-terminal helical bundle domain-containing protein n=1 Tax=Stylosanthes scabra TaxID=79078 RepID=A0ABU6VWZ1_9FABA|nr:hypothetical protein [Stylosanthes scabra]
MIPKNIPGKGYCAQLAGPHITTWDFANGMIRDDSTCTWYSLLITFEDHRFSLDQCCALVHLFDNHCTNFLRYSGFEEMAVLAAAMSKYLPTATTREEAVKAVRAFVAYLNRLAAWSFHYFPWDIGKHLTYYTTASVTAPSDLSRRVHVTEGIKVRMTWQPLGISVVVTLATKENPELCNHYYIALLYRRLLPTAKEHGMYRRLSRR